MKFDLSALDQFTNKLFCSYVLSIPSTTKLKKYILPK